LTQPGVQRSSFAALLLAPAARLAEVHSAAAVVMVDSWAALALMATIGDCFPSARPTVQKLCAWED
jgi:hypothetical protein